MTTATRRRLARLVVSGIGVARLGEGLVEVSAPRWFLARLGTPDTPAQVHLGFRMKGGRDAALGVLTVLALGDDDRLADLAIAAVVVDAADGLAVALDGGRTMGPPVDPAGAVLGFATAAIAWWAARQLR